MPLLRLDHVIYSVPDIESAHRELTARFPEAWPVGRFWPNGRMSGIAIGGINLELVQPDEDASVTPIATTLVFEPASPEDAMFSLRRAGFACHEFDKLEPDPALLRLRGFSREDAKAPQAICTNVLLGDPTAAPFDFFTCSYSPFLKEWLSSDHPRLETPTLVTRILYGTPQPQAAVRLLASLGYRGDIAIDFQTSDARAILGIETNRGPLGWP